MLSILATILLLIGVASGNSLSRIIGGTETTLDKHPHQVSLQLSGSHICGASIINSQWVITAAHCVGFGGTYSIALNDGNLDGNGKTYDVLRTFMHEAYDDSNFNNGAYPNDIALLKLSGEMDFDNLGHKEIGLAASGQTFDGQTCTISGWGYTKTGGVQSISNTLKQTTGTILTRRECSQVWGSYYNHAAHICIDDPSSGSCSGDSGGPMVCETGSGGVVLAGVTSWGVDGCEPSAPSVYARVSTYRDWIDTTIANN